MTEYTRVYGQFKGYTTEDCACIYCLHYAGKGKPCPLDVCCCAEEKRLAWEREQAANRPVTITCPA